MRFLFCFLVLVIISSCSRDLSKYGKVQTYSSASSGNATFLFKVEGSFAEYTGSSKQDEKHPLMNEDEAGLLNNLLIDKKLCLDQYNFPSYVITSKQERIYDVTFANLIEQSYNAKPATPLTYYGRCVKSR